MLSKEGVNRILHEMGHGFDYSFGKISTEVWADEVSGWARYEEWAARQEGSPGPCENPNHPQGQCWTFTGNPSDAPGGYAIFGIDMSEDVADSFASVVIEANLSAMNVLGQSVNFIIGYNLAGFATRQRVGSERRASVMGRLGQ